MPRRELRNPHQVTAWLEDWGRRLHEPGEMILIGSAALLWHVARLGSDEPLPENSMDADAVTDSEGVAELAYEAMIGSDFEKDHGWHVNPMPSMVLEHFPSDWRLRASAQQYGELKVIVPSPRDLLVPKLRRNEARDRQHEAFAKGLGLI
jgi:hypothetical protein